MTEHRLYPLLLVLIGSGALTSAYVAQYGFDLEPCILCLYQRVPYVLVALFGFSALIRPSLLEPLMLLAALAFAVGAAIAVYHVGVEQHWWVSAAGCSGDVSATLSTQDLMASMQTKPPKPCDAVDWTVLGVSMAGWNVVFSSLCAGATLYARQRVKED